MLKYLSRGFDVLTRGHHDASLFDIGHVRGGGSAQGTRGVAVNNQLLSLEDG